MKKILKKISIILGMTIIIALNKERTQADVLNKYTYGINQEMDNKVYNALTTFENNKEKDKVLVYEGNKKDTYEFWDYFNSNYGYDKGIRLDLYKINNKNQTFKLYFNNTKNADEKIRNYNKTLNKAINIAHSLKRNSDKETIDAIYNYVTMNGKVNIKAKQYQGDISDLYYGFYDNKEIVCGGFVSTINQLCNINGIKSEEVDGKKQGYEHGINKVYYNNKYEYIDATWKQRSEILFSDFIIE